MSKYGASEPTHIKVGLYVTAIFSLQMDETFQHPSIQLFIMGIKPPEGIIQKIQESNQKTDEVETSKEKDEDARRSNEEKVADSVYVSKDDCQLMTKLQNENLSDFEVRRSGSMAARLLRDVKIV